MITSKIIAAGTAAASLMSGVGLGGYTIGGFQVRQPVDLIAQAASRTQPAGDVPLAQAVQSTPMQHVCTGCDAKLYRDLSWYEPEPADQAEEARAREAQWAQDDEAALEMEGRDVADEQEPRVESEPIVAPLQLATVPAG